MPLLLDISGFEALFQVHYSALAITAYRITRDRDIAEDIVQHAFIKLWQEKDVLEIKDSVKVYLFQYVIGQSLKYIKKIINVGAREALLSADTDIYTLSGDSAFSVKEMEQCLNEAIDMLPASCRTVFILSRYEHLKYREIAHKVGLPVKTVESQMTKALRHLRNCLLS